MIGDGAERPIRSIVGQGSEGDDAPGIAACGVDAWADGVVEVVLGGHDGHKPRWSRFTAGEGIAAGDASRELAEEGALAEAGIAIEDGDLACRKPTGREPMQSFGRDLT